MSLPALAVGAAIALLLPAGAGAQHPLTLKSASIDLPADTRVFTGEEAALLNGRCLACHSASMALTQPKMSAPQWRATVVKMRDVYRAPIAEDEVEALARALAALPAD